MHKQHLETSLLFGFYVAKTWEHRESNILTHVNAKSVLFWGFKGSRGMWSINDLPEKMDKTSFFRGRIILLFWCHCTQHTTIRIIKTLHHVGKIHMRSSSISNWFATHQSKAPRKKKLEVEKSWKQLDVLQNVNMVHSVDQIFKLPMEMREGKIFASTRRWCFVKMYFL